jgi:hypothetical protein
MIYASSQDPYEVGDYVNGALHEGCSAGNDTILTLRNLSAVAKAQGRRLVYECHGKGGDDEIASFLIGVGPYQYYGLGGWSGGSPFESHWIDGVFNRSLGEPLGDAVYDTGSSMWSRSFKSGTKVVFNAHTKKGTTTWGQ